MAKCRYRLTASVGWLPAGTLVLSQQDLDATRMGSVTCWTEHVDGLEIVSIPASSLEAVQPGEAGPERDDIYDDHETDFVEPPEWMTAREYLELCAIAMTVKALAGPTSQYRGNWAGVRRLVSAKLITWQVPHPVMGKRFAAVGITEDGAKLVDATIPR